jgi:hypothetical protein
MSTSHTRVTRSKLNPRLNSVSAHSVKYLYAAAHRGSER